METDDLNNQHIIDNFCDIDQSKVMNNNEIITDNKINELDKLFNEKSIKKSLEKSNYSLRSKSNNFKVHTS